MSAELRQRPNGLEGLAAPHIQRLPVQRHRIAGTELPQARSSCFAFRSAALPALL